MNESQTEVLYTVSLLRHSEVEKDILSIERLAELESNSERQEFRFELLRTTQKKKLTKMIRT